ncbi:MAG: helix-turn-helix domain-containing protein [Sphingomonadales bacterium]|nr:helix-turn-helix domain-containing protein [Sphingomonadales bacterium]
MGEAVPVRLAYSVAEACAVSSLGRSTIYTLIASGRLDARRVGGRRIIMADSLRALLEGAEEGGRANS